MGYSEAHWFPALDKISSARPGAMKCSSGIVCALHWAQSLLFTRGSFASFPCSTQVHQFFHLSWTTWSSHLLSSRRCSPLMTVLRASTVILLTMAAGCGTSSRSSSTAAHSVSRGAPRRIARDACGDLKRSAFSVNTLKAKEEENEQQTIMSQV